MLNLRHKLLVPISLLLSSAASAQLPDDYWEFLRPYDDELLHIHSLMNYSYDLEWRFQWERRQMSDNALQISTGSVARDALLTDLNMNINEELNDKWRVQGRFRRLGLRQRYGSDDQLLLGFERAILDSSGIYLMADPQFDKEFMDVAAGYTFYKDNREQYVRAGIFMEDFNYERKNNLGAESGHQQLALQWQTRLGFGNDWFFYSEGEVGNGFDRTFGNVSGAHGVARHERRENSATVRISKFQEDGLGWAAWIEWFDFMETRAFQDPDLDYDYQNTLVSASVEHTRIFNDRHRWRFLAHYIDQQASQHGIYAHTFDRTDILGGVFYEYLWPNSGATLAYVFGMPDSTFDIEDPADEFTLRFYNDELPSYADKLIVGWRYSFSQNAHFRVSLSHEVSAQGFGGGSMQYQMFF